MIQLSRISQIIFLASFQDMQTCKFNIPQKDMYIPLYYKHKKYQFFDKLSPFQQVVQNQIVFFHLNFLQSKLILNTMADKLSISFDQENNIRVLDPERFRQSDHLKSLSMEFITKVIAMDENMSSLTECLDDFAIKIQKQKLRALGERNKWESEAQNRKRKMMELNNYLNEKKAQLQRYTVQLESLTKVEAEQKVLINKLSSNE